MTGAITNRVARLRAGEDPQLIARTPSGWAILANQQPEALPGCCMLLPDAGGAIEAAVPEHLEAMEPRARLAFLADFAALGEAVRAATACERVNYLMLCNQVPELHAHCVPRYAGEDPAKRKLGPFEAYDFAGARRAEPEGRDADLLARIKAQLALALRRG